ncbi:hypothetical protein NL676_018743 [Syzygium grande]|nr:hypothetical protein NL676_018743 [Syzygium grande]
MWLNAVPQKDRRSLEILLEPSYRVRDWSLSSVTKARWKTWCLGRATSGARKERQNVAKHDKVAAVQELIRSWQRWSTVRTVAMQANRENSCFSSSLSSSSVWWRPLLASSSMC